MFIHLFQSEGLIIDQMEFIGHQLTKIYIVMPFSLSSQDPMIEILWSAWTLLKDGDDA